jgi:hypothetical protein
VERREFLVGVAGLASGGCGSILHPERCGQPHGPHLDWKIVALDGLGLLLFFVPGVVAFVVDFCTGAIYLPAECCHPVYGPVPPPVYPPPPGSTPYYPSPPQASLVKPHLEGVAYAGDLNRIVLPREELVPQRIEEVVGQRLGRPISLRDDNVRLSPLERLDHYADQCRRHEKDVKFGFDLRSLFGRHAA